MDRAANVVESEVPGAGTGVTAFTPAVVAGATADMVGDPAIGERAGAAPVSVLNPQLLTEGADTWQAAGRAIALVTLRTTPN